MNRILKLAFAGLSLALAVGLTSLATALPTVAQAGPNTTVRRAYPWHSDRLELDIPANVEYRPGTTWQLTIRAPARTLDRIRVKGDRITAKPHGCFSLVPLCIGYGTDLNGTVHVDITGPALRVIKVEGASTIRLHGLHQNRLALKIDGSASVHGAGTVHDLQVAIDGTGDVHLSRLTEQHAQVVINGSGNVAIAPTDTVKVDIRGVGKVWLHANPAHVSSHVEGVGEVVRVPAR